MWFRYSFVVLAGMAFGNVGRHRYRRPAQLPVDLLHQLYALLPNPKISKPSYHRSLPDPAPDPRPLRSGFSVDLHLVRLDAFLGGFAEAAGEMGPGPEDARRGG